ncbi:peptide chain release factor N(5)-glutamine methyltransferase [Porphyromonas endodontalis]|uniref:peptide chain release factor N(5)-glutamine methyltransferase n=1 Tax=Porphyromonas endodontalis TaxID=28124 RepID=UPI003C7DA317
MHTVGSIQTEALLRLSPLYSREEARSLVRILLEEILSISRTQLLMASERPLDEGQEVRFWGAVERLLYHEPIQYILGHAPFGALDLFVAPGVLIPRPETEELCATIVERHQGQKGLRILDLGTGSGCIALYLAQMLPQAEVFALEKSDQAAAIAQRNFDRSGLGFSSPQLLRGDMLEVGSWASSLPPLDIIVSNPPYIQPTEAVTMESHVLEHEPHLALFAPESDPLLFYRAIYQLAARLPMQPSAHIYLELNALLAEDTLAIFAEAPHIYSATLFPDLSGKSRFLTATLTS